MPPLLPDRSAPSSLRSSRAPQRPRLCASAALAGALLAALPGCGGALLEVGVGHPAIPVFHESEPNDGSAGPDWIGAVHAGDAFEVDGHASDDCCDPFDGFAIDVGEPVVLHLELDAHDGWSDLDLCVYDPWADVWVACFESSANPEFGSVAIGGPGELHLVVRSWIGSSPYTLRVEADALPGGYAASRAPADPSAGWDAYRAEPTAPFDLRVEPLKSAEDGAFRARLVSRAEGDARLETR